MPRYGSRRLSILGRRHNELGGSCEATAKLTVSASEKPSTIVKTSASQHAHLERLLDGLLVLQALLSQQPPLELWVGPLNSFFLLA